MASPAPRTHNGDIRHHPASKASVPAPRSSPRRQPAPRRAVTPRLPVVALPQEPPLVPLSKQDEIFAAALRLFQEKGYHGASMQDLAAAVGMQKASLYYYFHSKEDLLVLVCERGTGAFTQELQDIVASEKTATQKLRLALECHLGALCAQLDLFTVFLREQKFLGQKHKTRLRAQAKRHAELLEQILAQGIASGEFQPVNISVATLAILGMCNWLYVWYSPDGALDPPAIAALFAGLILNGLTNPSASVDQFNHRSLPLPNGKRGNSK